MARLRLASAAEKRLSLPPALFLTGGTHVAEGGNAVLWQPFSNMMVDIACYAQLAAFRALVANVGDVYREHIDPELASANWSQELLALAGQTDTPRVGWG